MATNNVWYNWVSTSSTTYTVTSDAESYSGTAAGVWYDWVSAESSTTGAITGQDYVWYTWVSDGTGNSDPTAVWRSYRTTGEDVAPVVKVARETIRAQRAQWEIERVWNKVLADELKAEKEAAESKAKELLLDLIGPEQLRVYEETGRLFVRGRKHDYIVREGHKHIRKITKDKILDLCVHIPLSLPSTDNVIALKLALEADEDEVVRIANHHSTWDRPARLDRAACM